MMKFQILFPLASLTFRLTLTLQGQTLTFHLQFQMTKAMTSCQCHSFAKNSPEIWTLFERALDEKEISQVPVCYYIKNDILMRKWRPPNVYAEDEWTVNHQIVVPRVYRPEILNLAHETPMSGHFGVNMTYHKILKK